MKRIIALLLVVLFAVSLSACNFNDLYDGEDAEAPTADLPEKDPVTAIPPESSETEKNSGTAIPPENSETEKNSDTANPPENSETEKYPSENRLISAYKDSNPNYTDASVMYYYGIYNNNVVAMMDHGGNYFGEIWSEKIGETSIEYRNSNRIVVLIENNTFLTLTEAYGQGLLTDADIADIAAKHKGFLK